MKTENYNWKTTFETADETLMHVFSDRVKVILDFKFGIVTTVRDDEPIDKFECGDMTISEYETFLLGIAKSAEPLKLVSHE
jgi:hypothetical protein